MKTIKSSKICPFRRLWIRIALSRVAKALVRASKESVVAGDDILYHLPGVFSFSIQYGDSKLRLIKEANQFRIMENAEKSDILLSATIEDAAALGDLAARKATWHKVYAEGRVAFIGKMKYASLVMRVAAEGDKYELTEEARRDLYGE